MSEDMVKTIQVLLQEEKDEDRKNICGYKIDSCFINHPEQEPRIPCFFSHSKDETRRKPFNKGRICYLNEMCNNLKDGECGQGNECKYCHSELEYLYHPVQYKTQMCQKGSHPFPDFCPHAHTEEDVRLVEGYFQWLQISSQNLREEQNKAEDLEQESEEKPLDKVDDLPTKLPGKRKGGKMKKSVSMNVAGPGGMEAAFPLTKKKKQGRNRKKSNKSKKSVDGKMVDALCFLDLKTFKVKQCTAGTNHNPKKCLNYHDFKRDRRRPIGTYSSEQCKNVSKGGECRYGDNCKRAHNRVEEFYHPEKYKVKFCSKYPNDLDSCEYGQFCSFAHHPEEIKIDLIDEMERDEDFYMFHFKTVWCPYTEKKHARDECVYAHNWQDFRRKPQLFPYSHEQCPQWHSRTFIQVYGDGCKNEFLCPYSHGWKEQEYHPK